jgi:hypothetical protein
VNSRSALVSLVALQAILLTQRLDAASIYSLRLYNTDDTLQAFITNAAYVDQLMLSNPYDNDTGFVDVSSYVTAGKNTIELRLANSVGGYTYGYDLLKDGTSIDADTCGTVNSMGCNSNDNAPGTVFVHTLTFGLSPAQAPDALRLFNTDDTLEAYVTNSAHAGQLVLSNTFGNDTGPVDIGSFVVPGANRFDLSLTNSIAGYTYGFEFTADGSIVDEGTCGVTGTVGCNDNNLARGTVFTHSLLFESPAAVPEPSTLLFLGSGLLAGARRLRSRRS